MRELPQWLRTTWPFYIAIILFALAVTGTYSRAISLHPGAFTYAVDDAYIHAAIARSIAEHGIWGVTQYEFTSSSSSILWTILLAASFCCFGVHIIIPFILNILAAVAVLLLSSFVARCWGLPKWPEVVFLMAMALCTSLVSLAFVGMEHTIHVFLTLLFVYLASESLAGGASRSMHRGLPLVSMLLTAVRYEGLLTAAIVCSLLLLQRRLRYAVTLGLCSVLPVLIYGLGSLSLGWSFLPNSILAKSTPLGFASAEQALNTLGLTALRQLATQITVELPLVAAALLSAVTMFRRSERNSLFFALIITTLSIVAHAQFARFHWFFRYEAYLIALSLASIAAAGWHSMQRSVSLGARATTILLTVLIGRGLLLRGYETLSQTPLATQNIHDQQIQMSRFFTRYYNTDNIALNDIGAVCFFTDAHVTDLAGLATRETVNALFLGNPKILAEQFYRLAAKNQVAVAALYESWFDGRIPTTWKKAGEWTLNNNIVCGSPAVSFYAINNDEYPALKRHLEEYSAVLPVSVAWKNNN